MKDALDSVTVTGAIGKPMITLHGTLDALLPISTDSDVYAAKLRALGKGAMHRYYVVEDGNHVDGLVDAHPQELRPILPCYRAAFQRLTAWVTTGAEPPQSQTVARPASGDLANTCTALDAPAATPTATASATPTATAAPCPAPALRVRTPQITAGQAGRVHVDAREGELLRLFAYTRPSTDYQQVREGTAGPDGLDWDVRPGANTRLYAQLAGVCGGRSESATIGVTSTVSLTVERLARHRYVVRGTARPARPGQVVSLRLGDRLLAQGRTDRAGRYAIDRSFMRDAVLDLRTTVGRDVVAGTGSSPVRRTAVR